MLIGTLPIQGVLPIPSCGPDTRKPCGLPYRVTSARKDKKTPSEALGVESLALGGRAAL
jgi:hypothetical protein